MCGRYTIRRPGLIKKLVYQSSFEEFSQIRIEPRFNIAPSQSVPVVRLNKEAVAAVKMVRWGLIPSWTKEKPKQQPINARAETVATSGMFRQALARRRCLVPADGFYEWQKLGDPKRPTKQPMYVHRDDDDVFAFAGLWERWKPDADAEPVDTFTIITTAPNALMSPIHDRMPVILSSADYNRWLSRDVPGEDVLDLLRPHAVDGFVADKVSTRCNSPRNDDCDCVAPLAE
ncbi:MAG TPA: SOS response-associated peptidase [Tepidisphaeraceae bacterium]|jgi:putative SOS response-associated peptidase YedK